jgi:transcription-repair coupling factor (superfamily II helicase)
LSNLPGLKRGILIVPLTSLMHRLCPKEYVIGNSLMLKVGGHFQPDAMRRTLLSAGYQCVDSVHEHGEFAVRGAIMDIYPMGSDEPYRIDLFDDEIESLRIFDPETQRSLHKVESIHLLPGKEYPMNEAGISLFRSNFRNRFDADLRQCSVYQDISQGLHSAGIEYYLPLCSSRQCTHSSTTCRRARSSFAPATCRRPACASGTTSSPVTRTAATTGSGRSSSRASCF